MPIFQVTEVKIAVDAAEKVSFGCFSKKTFYFTGTITSNAAGTATYRWERSDGIVSPASTLYGRFREELIG